MKVLLIKDVYKLGHAGEVKKVADGYGRNYLLPNSMAVLATPGALRQSEKIATEATKRRAILNHEMEAVSGMVVGTALSFAMKAGETGKLYGSITTQQVADALRAKTGVDVKRQQIELQPIRALGEFPAHVRLTVDLIPEIKIVVYREGDSNPIAEPAAPAAEASPAPAAEEPAAE